MRVLSLLLAAGGSLDLILGGGFSQLSVSFKNLEVICSAQPGLAWTRNTFAQFFPAQAAAAAHSTATQNTRTKRRGEVAAG